jgi:hypothetical protein
MSLKKWKSKISRQSCRGDCEWPEGKLLRLLSGFRSRIRPLQSDSENVYVIEPDLKNLDLDGFTNAKM